MADVALGKSSLAKGPTLGRPPAGTPPCDDTG